ncbi:hypothetical protein B0H13DRAFT_1864678 [Mycena leptocephala]|nr:hypothetical protein B0H13DRAFT_1864678 [Mycena leptocephala]
MTDCVTRMKKIIQDPPTLAHDIALAKARYTEKQNHFIGLTVSFRDRAETWRAQDRTASKKGKEAVSVYKHQTSKDLRQAVTFSDHFRRKESEIVHRRQLRSAIQENTEHNLEATRKDVLSRRTEVTNLIATWRKQQQSITPKLGDKVSKQAAASPVVPVEKERLFLPSDLTPSERHELDVVALGIEGVRWREGQAFDALRGVQNVVKALRALRDRKTKNDRKQKDNIRAGDEIDDTTNRRDRHMQSYVAARQAMISLGALVDGPNTGYPPLTVADTFMKSVRQARQVGDSKFTDGLLWRVSGGLGESPSHVAPIILAGTTVDTADAYTEIRSSTTGPTSQSENKLEERPEGWLWQLGKVGKLSQREIDEWSNEGDRVQWFRAEAEMQRWQEQKEQKLVELLRTIRSFTKMQQVWIELANQHSSNQPGHAAYARQKAWMYQRRAEEAQNLVRSGGHGDLLAPTANVIEFIERERAAEREYLLSRLQTEPTHAPSCIGTIVQLVNVLCALPFGSQSVVRSNLMSDWLLVDHGIIRDYRLNAG